jgi:hypothetical protein
MNISIKHPTDRTNFTTVDLGSLSLAFSYTTVVGFSLSSGWVVCENDWGSTTGKHLNWLEPDKKRRLPRAEFEKQLSDAMAKVGL